MHDNGNTCIIEFEMRAGNCVLIFAYGKFGKKKTIDGLIKIINIFQLNYSGRRPLTEWSELRTALRRQLLLAVDYANTLKPIADLGLAERVCICIAFNSIKRKSPNLANHWKLHFLPCD